MMTQGSSQLEQIRLAAGLTLDQAGDRLGISPQGVRHLEIGEKTGRITLAALARAARAYGYTLHYNLQAEKRAPSALNPEHRPLERKDLRHQALDARLKQLGPLAAAELELVPSTRTMWLNGQSVKLSRLQCLLMYKLLAEVEREVSFQALCGMAWDQVTRREMQIVRVMINRLRRALSALEAHHLSIGNRHGEGYELASSQPR